MTNHCEYDIARQLGEAAKCVEQGGVIAYPTEHCFGLGCDPADRGALQRILDIKQRKADQGLILVANSIEQLSPYVDFAMLSEDQRTRIEASWPGFVSWLIPARDGCEPLLCGSHRTQAVRVSAFELIQDLCQQANSALVSTSANRHAQPALTSANAVAEQMGCEIDYIVNAPVQGLARPSRIIDALTKQPIRS